MRWFRQRVELLRERNKLEAIVRAQTAEIHRLREELAAKDEPPSCCYSCAQRWADARPPSSLTLMAVAGRMFVCDRCGNKRCPHATSHRLACTGSNEPGQDGSRYGALGREAVGE